MPRAYDPIFDAIRASGPSRADAVARLEMLSRLLDDAFTIPGTNRRIGLDAVIGLVPGIGDTISAALSAYIVWEARNLGLPRWKIARMLGNVALDAAVGAVPLVGDVFDATFKANRRNMRIIREHLGMRGGPGVIDGRAVRLDERPR